MNRCESEAYKNLKYICDISDSISGLMFGCSYVYKKYEKFISKYRFLNIVKKINKEMGKTKDLEYFIELFPDKEKFRNFNERNEFSIDMYGKVTVKIPKKWGV